MLNIFLKKLPFINNVEPVFFWICFTTNHVHLVLYCKFVQLDLPGSKVGGHHGSRSLASRSKPADLLGFQELGDDVDEHHLALSEKQVFMSVLLHFILISFYQLSVGGIKHLANLSLPMSKWDSLKLKRHSIMALKCWMEINN